MIVILFADEYIGRYRRWKKESEKSEEEGTTPLPMDTGEADMGVDAELEDNNTSYNYDFNISNLTRGNVLDKGYGPTKTANN